VAFAGTGTIADRPLRKTNRLSYLQYWDVDNRGGLFFRLQVPP
jgi:hypothetical protein